MVQIAVSAKFHGTFWELAAEAMLALGTLKLALTTSTYTPNQDTHDYFNDVTNEVAAGGGYTAGGAAISSPTVTYDTATNTIKIDGGDVSWTSATFTARWGIVYVSTGTASTSPIVGHVDFDGDKSPSDGTLSVVWNAAGVATAIVS